MSNPMPAHLRCPWCDTRHIDVGEWETRPHHKHLCAACKRLFRVEGENGEHFYGIPDDDHYAGAGHDVTPRPEAPTPVCATCNDMHRMLLSGQYVCCTRCPTPCEKCRGRNPGGGATAYCATTPCSCSCHIPPAPDVTATVKEQEYEHDKRPCSTCGFPGNCHEDNPLFKDHAYTPPAPADEEANR